jgi:hypothetical protein
MVDVSGVPIAGVPEQGNKDIKIPLCLSVIAGLDPAISIIWAQGRAK